MQSFRMASITVRELPNQTKEKLRVQAAQSGVSLEAYVRQVLLRASAEGGTPGPDVASLARKYFGPEHGVELDLPSRGSGRPPIDFRR